MRSHKLQSNTIMKYTSKYAFLALALSAGLVPVVGCDHSVQPSNSNSHFLPFTVPVLNTAYYGVLAVHGGTGQVAFSEFADPTVHSKTFTLPTTTSAAGYFGAGDAVTGLTINSQPIGPSGTGPGLHYYTTAPTLNTNGTNNTFSWTSGSSVYSSTIAGNIGSVAISSPTFNSIVSKTSNLTVSWSPSADPDDYVQISLVGKANAGSSATSVGEYEVFADDNGSFVIPSSVLGGFSESHMRIVLTRGKYTESTIGGHNFLTTMYTTNQIDVDLS
jgi:hypothetical protein